MAGLSLGFLTAFLGFAHLVASGLALLFVLTLPKARHGARSAVRRAARSLVELERWRLSRFLRSDNSGNYSGERALQYLVIRSTLGMLGGAVLVLIIIGVLSSPAVIVEVWTVGFSFRGALLRTGYMFALGVVLLYLALTGVVGVAAAERALARGFLGPSREELLSRRVETLSTTRAEVVDAVNDERRRIERDLHDGVQQRLVSLGLLIARARRGGDEAKTTQLLRQAHEESQLALRDLREVAWRVYPAALDAGGLRPALDLVADRAGVPVRISYDLETRPSEAIETVAYFVVSEAVTNAAKHSGAESVIIHIGHEEARIVLWVFDDGRGGAKPDGAGLSGLARRVAALDGVFRVHSPDGGPTTIRAELPCE